jgi:hypothetical protein
MRVEIIELLVMLRIAVVLAVCAACPAVFASSNVASQKLAEINSATSQSSSLLTLTDTNFEHFVTDSNRAYHMFVLFNAPSGQFKCDMCQPAQDELTVAAASYAAHRAAVGYADAEKPAFFGVAMFNTNRNAFGQVRYTCRV